MGNAQTIDFGDRHLRIRRQVGEGAYSFIFYADDDRGKRYAVKQVIMPAGDEERNQMARKEQKIMTSLPAHPNIVPVYGTTVMEENGKINYFSLLQFCPSSVLSIMSDAYSKGMVLPERLALKIFQSAALAILHLHTQSPPIAHRDIKVENMLLSDDGNYKLCDFGSCMFCPVTSQPQPSTINISHKEILTCDDEMKRNTTAAYRAPEQVDMYTRKLVCELVDVWAVGVMLFKLTVGRTPFEDLAGNVNNMGILNGQIKFPSSYGYSAALQEFILFILQVDIEKRPDIYDVLVWGEVHYARGELNDWSSLLPEGASGSVEDEMGRLFGRPVRSFTESSSSSSSSSTPIRPSSTPHLASINTSQQQQFVQFTPLPNSQQQNNNNISSSSSSSSSSFTSMISRRVFNFSKSVGNILANLAGADMEFYHWICKCSSVPSASSSAYQQQIKLKFVRRICDVIQQRIDKFNDFMYFVSLRVANLDRDENYHVSLIRLFSLILLVLNELQTQRIDYSQFSDYSQFFDSLVHHIVSNKSDHDQRIIVDISVGYASLLGMIMTLKPSDVTCSGDLSSCLDSLLSSISEASKLSAEHHRKVYLPAYMPLLIYAKRVLVQGNNSNNSHQQQNHVLSKFLVDVAPIEDDDDDDDDEDSIVPTATAKPAQVKSNTLDDFTQLSSFDIFQTNDPRAYEFSTMTNKLTKVPSDEAWSGWVANPPSVKEKVSSPPLASSLSNKCDLLGLGDDDDDDDVRHDVTIPKVEVIPRQTSSSSSNKHDLLGLDDDVDIAKPAVASSVASSVTMIQKSDAVIPRQTSSSSSKCDLLGLDDNVVKPTVVAKPDSIPRLPSPPSSSSSSHKHDLLGLDSDSSFAVRLQTVNVKNVSNTASSSMSAKPQSKPSSSSSLLDGYDAVVISKPSPVQQQTVPLPMNDMIQVMTQPALQPWRQANLTPNSAIANCLDSVLAEFMSWNIDIPFSAISVVEVIGTGGFAIVYKGSFNNQTVAIKKLQSSLGHAVDTKTLLDFKSEADFMRKLMHVNIISLIGVCDDPVCMVLEYCCNGSLFSLIHDQTSNSLSWNIRFDIVLGIALGMQYLHSFNPPIIHRDMKSLNILLSDDFVPKITDFGLSRLSSTSADDDSFMTSQAGTYQWMAVEIITGQKKYNEKVDVYSFAVIMWEVLTMLIPFEGMQPIQIVAYIVARNQRLQFPVAMIEASSSNDGLRQLMRLIQECWQTNPIVRPSFTDIVNRLRNLPRNVL